MIYLDIETRGNEKMRPFIMEGAHPPGNYSKPESIEKWFREEEVKRVEKMALDVDLARIVALGWVVDNGQPWVSVCHSADQERQALNAFWLKWAVAGYPRICGYNVLDFDIPIILRRSLFLQIDWPARLVDFRRYSTDSVVDLMQLFYNWGNAPGVRYRGLKTVAKMLGITNRCPDLDGSQVAEMDDTTLISYCINDLKMTRDLANLTRGLYWR